ncbi:Holliday junction DNA helicase RuvB [Cyclobacterium qasimii M12-11B]|uniref:Holliday junction DNA helicase RuvB n=1 Tax=Cyclobacterium qasimii M12-11B TaxID=641524 RepID=S7V7M0_9BACT|nr:Holliday junction DNA helicase RuvB [Cyclobacterium qasimii M12-11B]
MREDYLRGDQESFSTGDKEIEKALRPLSFDDFTGQKKTVENIKIFVMAAKKGMNHWTMCCFMALPDWAKLP